MELKLGLNPNLKYAFAVSGGIDSMVLLRLAAKENLVGFVVTIDHSIREDSAADAEFVRKEAAALGYDAKIVKVDVPAAKAKSGESTELTARLLRYAEFDALINNGSCDGVVLAHHLDDKCETVLLRLLRGTGVAGLAAMEERKGYFRPLIRYTRKQIEEYALDCGVAYREDSTNSDVYYRRNFLRHEVLPLIESRYPAYRTAIESLSAAAAETESFFDRLTTPAEVSDGRASLPMSELLAPPALWKRSVRRALLEIGIVKDIEKKTYETIASLISKPSNKSVDLGQGIVASVEYGRLVFAKKNKPQQFMAEFDVNEKYFFNGRSYAFSSTESILPHLTFDVDKLPQGTLVRTRLPGDVFKKYGGGHKPLAEYFCDIKLRPDLRDSVLLLASDSEVFVVLGIEISAAVAVDESTSKMTVVNVTER